VQVRLRELENQQATLKSELAEIRTRRKHMEQEPLDPDEAMALFARFAELFEQATAEEKEALADTILKSATVGPDKSVEFEFYAGSDPGNVVQNDKFGSAEASSTNSFTTGGSGDSAFFTFSLPQPCDTSGAVNTSCLEPVPY